MKTLNLNTNGGEFYIMGTTQDYSGPYWIDDSGAIHTGRSATETPNSQMLVPILGNVKEYKQTSAFQLGMPIVQIRPSPTANDYKVGWFTRYFVQQSNDPNSYVFEIDQKQFDQINGMSSVINYPRYIAVSLRWKIVGPLHDLMDNLTLKVVDLGVADTNARSIKNAKFIISNIDSRLQNLAEFWKGDGSTQFLPPQNNVNGKLSV